MFRSRRCRHRPSAYRAKIATLAIKERINIIPVSYACCSSCGGGLLRVREVEITTACPECRGDHLIRDYSRAEIVCEDCGLVLDDMIIDEGPEWRAFDSEQRESRERAGPPSTIMAPEKGPSTSIGWRYKDAYRRQIPHNSRAQSYRLPKCQHRIRTGESG